MAVAPPGGWRQRKGYIKAMATPTAIDAASIGSWPSHCWLSTPASADTLWPPNTDQGCDIPPWGAANSSTAEDPIELATRPATCSPTRRLLTHHTNRIPNSPPTPDIQCSRSETV